MTDLYFFGAKTRSIPPQFSGLVGFAPVWLSTLVVLIASLNLSAKCAGKSGPWAACSQISVAIDAHVACW